MKTYSQLQQENELLRRLACMLMQTETIPGLVSEVAALRDQQPTPEPESSPDPEPLQLKLRVKAEAYEYRIYELEIAYMMQDADTAESEAARTMMERVTANYHRDYPGRPLNPKPRPDAAPTGWATVRGPGDGQSKKARKPYTRKVKPSDAAAA
ncbi:hypothetical protein DNI29_04335 [Hymenobacter sediminis]|uniref:hypothetical protein n=1 Tax=Hymenobacter sediminis TaxID=2218621 RepID=UPI000F4FD0FF|nr:hypothetical protein [Hymenobacter sediminis]RPD50031.1 hypothetical protein DNI29_04335 [Hymenobacter sediminis]